jgi:hypothetical protein
MERQLMVVERQLTVMERQLTMVERQLTVIERQLTDDAHGPEGELTPQNAHSVQPRV